MIVDSYDVYPAERLFGGKNSQHTASISGSFYAPSSTEFGSKIRKLLENYLCNIAIYSYGYFEVYFYYDDRNKIVENINTLVQEYYLEDVTIEYIMDDTHYNIISSSQTVHFIHEKSIDARYRNYKFCIEYDGESFDLVDVLETAKKCGFEQDGDSEKCFLYNIVNNRNKAYSSSIVSLYFNNISDAFILKCKFKDSIIRNVLYCEYDGIYPKKWVNRVEK